MFAGMILTEVWPWSDREGAKRWVYGRTKPTLRAFDLGGNAEILKPFKDEERYFVTCGRQRGWITGGLMDAMGLALEYMKGTE